MRADPDIIGRLDLALVILAGAVIIGAAVEMWRRIEDDRAERRRRCHRPPTRRTP
jgi:hypothetical protein